eukprot:gene23888-biopygen9697
MNRRSAPGHYHQVPSDSDTIYLWIPIDWTLPDWCRGGALPVRERLGPSNPGYFLPESLLVFFWIGDQDLVESSIGLSHFSQACQRAPRGTSSWRNSTLSSIGATRKMAPEKRSFLRLARTRHSAFGGHRQRREKRPKPRGHMSALRKN